MNYRSYQSLPSRSAEEADEDEAIPSAPPAPHPQPPPGDYRPRPQTYEDRRGTLVQATVGGFNQWDHNRHPPYQHPFPIHDQQTRLDALVQRPAEFDHYIHHRYNQTHGNGSGYPPTTGYQQRPVDYQQRPLFSAQPYTGVNGSVMQAQFRDYPRPDRPPGDMAPRHHNSYNGIQSSMPVEHTPTRPPSLTGHPAQWNAACEQPRPVDLPPGMPMQHTPYSLNVPDDHRIEPPSHPVSRRALIIGCNYPENIRTLVDDPTMNEDNCWLKPTRCNIIKHIHWLVKDAIAGDHLFFHFSGHAAQSNYVPEGYNQCLLPTDHEEVGQMVDDDINRLLIRHLPEGCFLHALVDCCHSGGLLDLQFEVTSDRWMNRGSTTTYKGTNGGTVIQYSACGENQSTHELKGEQAIHSCGAATMAFLSGIINFPNVTYNELLKHMEKEIKEFNKKAGSAQGYLRRKLRYIGRKHQKPQLSSNMSTIDLNSRITLPRQPF